MIEGVGPGSVKLITRSGCDVDKRSHNEYYLNEG